MNSLSVRISAAVLTFLIGIGLATVWAFNRGEPRIEPVNVNPNSATLEMVFVLDTTGSMGGLLEGAKQRIWGIVNEVMQASSHPNVKIGLVAYRDRGDEYVTQVLPLTEDLDKVYMTLMNYDAAGGGDMQEDVRRALADGVKKAGAEASLLLVVPSGGVLEIGFSKRSNDEPAAHSTYGLLSRVLRSPFLDDVPAVACLWIGFKILHALVQDFPVPFGHGNRLRRGRNSIPQGLHVVDLLVD